MKTESGSIRWHTVPTYRLGWGVLIRFHILDKNQHDDLKWVKPKSDSWKLRQTNWPEMTVE